MAEGAYFTKKRDYKKVASRKHAMPVFLCPFT